MALTATGEATGEVALPRSARRRSAPPTFLVTRSQAARYVTTRIPEVIAWHGLRRPWLAEQMGYDLSGLSLVLSGKRPITPRFVTAACTVLRLPPSILFVERDDARPRLRHAGGSEPQAGVAD